MDFSVGAEILHDISRLPERAKELILAYLYERVDCAAGTDICVIHMISRGFFCEDCGSPIEHIFRTAYELVLSEQDTPELCAYSLEPQVRVQTPKKTYIADFIVETRLFPGVTVEREHASIIVECDGHNFHEKTKEQVAYGNERDLALMEAGYHVIHFSGSQIFNDPIKCATDVINFAKKVTGKVTLS